MSRLPATSLGLGLVMSLLLVVGVLVPATIQAQGGNLPAFSGSPLGQAEINQGTKVMVFFTTWSPRCRDIFSRVASLEQQWGGRSEIIAVNFQEDRDVVTTFLAGKAPRSRVVMDIDGTLAKKHGITNLPGLLVVRNGEVLYSGKLPDDPDSLLSRLLG